MRKIVSLCLMLFVSMMMWANKTLYLMPNSNWLSANAKFVVYYFDNSTQTNGWSDIMTAVEGEENLFMTTVPETFPNIIFVRLNSTATEGSWDVKWNQSNDLDMPTGTLNCYYMGEADVWDYPAGRWMTYGNVEPQPQDTTVTPEPVATPHFYLTGNEAFVGAGKATWNKEDGYVSYGDTLTLNLGAGTYEVQLINANDEWKGYDALSQPIAENITTNSWGNICFYMAQAGQVTFIYKTDNTFLIQGTFAIPRYHFYYIGNAINWIVDDALEFEYQDSVYTLSLATLEGEFKIMTARDWSELSFGRNSSTEYITPGVPYEMTAWTNANIVVNGTLSNVTLQLTYVNQVATITVIENNPGGGGEQPQDTTIVPPVVDEVTVYTLMPEGWAALNAYVWPDEGSNYVAWPGVAMTPTGLVFRNAAVYSYTFPANYTHIIFNNGEGGQTANLDVNPATPCYYDNAWHATFEATPVDTTGGGEQPQDTTSVTPGPQDTTEVAMITYYAVNSPRWPMPYAYVWKGESDAYKPWPGETMTHTGENFRGYEVYSYTMPKEYTNMVINNGKGGNGNQTPDMVLDTTLRYMYNLQWYASLEAIPADQQDTTGGEPQDTTIVTAERYYLVGLFNNWDASAAVEFQNMDSLYTLTLDTLKGEFKVIDAQDWAHNIYGAWSTFDIPLGGNYGLFNSTKSVNLTLDGDYTNVTLNLKKNGNDLFLFFVAGTLIPQDTTATPEPQDTTEVAMITYYAVNSPRWPMPYAYVWKGESDAYKPWPGETMTRTGENFRGYEVYSYTMPAEYTKMIINNGKGGDNNQTPDMVLDTTLRYMYNLQWYASLEAIPADQQDTTGGEPQDTTTVAEITVYTVMPEGWAALNAYVWPDEGTNYVAWPGEAMTPTGLVFRNAAVYSYTFPANYTHIIFNNGEGGQTANMDVNPATPCYYKGEWYASFYDAPAEQEPEYITIYTVKPEGWTALNAYAWGLNYYYMDWPGVPMTNTGEVFRGDSVYAVLLTDQCTKIIFNEGVDGAQTRDINIEPGKYYYYADQWFASWDSVPEEIVVIPATYYIMGNDNLTLDLGLGLEDIWNPAAYKATSDTTVLNLLAGKEYNMELSLNGQWGEGNIKSFNDLTEVTVGVLQHRFGYISFTLAEDGPVTIIYNDSVFKILGTFIVPEPVEDMTIYTVLPAGWDIIRAYVWNDEEGNFIGWPGEAMDKTNEVFRGDTVYSYTFPSNYNKVIFNNGAGGQTQDIILDPTKPYRYADQWFASWDEVPEEVVVLPAKYYVAGNENLVVAAGLSTQYAFDAAAIKATSDTTVLNLFANTEYKLKITLHGSWATDVKGYYHLTEVTPGLTADEYAYIVFTPAEDGPVTIIYNDSVFTVNGNFAIPAKDSYYIKNNWNGGVEWTWQPMNALDADSLMWEYTDVFGGQGVNISIDGNDAAPSDWYDIDDMYVALGDIIPQAMDTVTFIYNVAQQTVQAIVIGRPGSVEPQPQPVEKHYYLVGGFNNWNIETAIEFTTRDSVLYSVTVDTLFGSMKVLVSRETWEGNYGVADMNDAILTMGEPKALVPFVSGVSDSYDFSVENTLVNAELNLIVSDNGIFITLVSGTPYVVPVEEQHFYLVGEFNDWTVESAPEFTYVESVYTITIDTLYGGFKVVDARDWAHGNYGAHNDGDVLNVGGEYIMWNSSNSSNLSLSTTYTNVTLNLTYVNNVVTIYFVSGTLVPTGLDTTVGNNSAATMKVIENGVLYILRDGKKYNAEGQLVR